MQLLNALSLEDMIAIYSTLSVKYHWPTDVFFTRGTFDLFLKRRNSKKHKR